MNTFFTSDTHFGHSNIIKYCNRPFNYVEEMDEVIISNWNSKVSKTDLVYHLGDFCFRNFESYFSRLNGRIVLIKGNHDSLAKQNKSSFFEYYDGFREVNFNKTLFVLCHYSMNSWNEKNRGSYHLFGHSHGRIKTNDKSMDIGVDTNNFYPYSFEEVIQKISNKFSELDYQI